VSTRNHWLKYFFGLLAWALAGSPAGALTLDQFDAPKNARVGIFMGTFDPPHNSHHAVMEAALATGGLDYVIVIPNDTPLHKPNAYSTEVRLQMLKSLYAVHPRIITPHKTDFGGSMRIKIIDKIRKTRPDVKLTGIYGTDILQENLKNKFARQTFRKRFDAMFVTTNRPGVEGKMPEKFWGLPTTYATYQDAQTSSTRIRNYLKDNPDFLAKPLGEEAGKIADELGIDPRTLHDIHRLRLYSAPEPRSCQWFWSALGKVLEPKK
jgi:cytidyltransferase-like protein